MRLKFLSLVLILLGLFVTAASAQGLAKLADDTIKYVKAGTFGKPDVAKKTEKVAIGQVRVHFKTVTSRSAVNRDNAADVTVYLDSDLTTADLAEITDDFYRSLTLALGKIGIQTTPFDAVKASEYYADKLAKRADDKNADFDGKLGQAWVSVNAYDGPVLFRYRPFGVPETVAWGQAKKLAKTAEVAGGDLMMVDVVLDFASIMLATEIKQDRDGWLYSDPYFHANYNIAGLMNVPESYVYMYTAKNKFDIYRSGLPVAERFAFSEKPRKDESKAAYSTQKYFNGQRLSFTPLVIPAKRDQYKIAAKRALARYADILAEKFRVIRSGEKPEERTVAKGPALGAGDPTTIEQVKAKAKAENDTTPVTTGELKDAIERAKAERKYQLAHGYYGELIKLEPEVADHYLQRAVLQMNHIGDLKAAVKDLDQMLKLAPNNLDGLYNRGTCYVQLSEFKKAKKDLDIVVANVPNLATAWLNRGIALLNLKQTEAAIEDFNRGIQLAPRLPNLYRARAVAYKVLGNASLAAADELRAAQLGQ